MNWSNNNFLVPLTTVLLFCPYKILNITSMLTVYTKTTNTRINKSSEPYI